MLRLPAMRGPLQVLSARSEGMQALCEAFDDATRMSEKLAKASQRDDDLIVEYEALCRELETAVLDECLTFTQLKIDDHQRFT